jgi:hypothetical protein
LILTVLMTASNASADELCSQLTAFENARFDGAEHPNGRRWAELHWVGSWLDLKNGWGFECRSSGDAVAKGFCSWLVEHSPSEFSTYLPIGILECHGYRFPKPYDSWAHWRSEIEIWRDGREAMLEVNFPDIEGQPGAIRLSTFADNVFDSDAGLPPLGPAPSEQEPSSRAGEK